MRHAAGLVFALVLCSASGLAAQGDDVMRRDDGTLYDRSRQDVQRSTWRRTTVHYGKWLTAGGALAFTLMAADEHRSSKRDWDQLLEICRSGETACARAPDGRYQNTAAEALYQSALYYDGRARRRLLGAQASVLVTAALFILDRRPGDGPDNIPFSPLRVAVESTPGGAALALRWWF